MFAALTIFSLGGSNQRDEFGGVERQRLSTPEP
jgi:hypothetical protein